MDALLSYAEDSSSGSTISFIWSVASIVGLWMMFTKMNEAGWKAIIPFYNQYILCGKTMRDPWYWVRLFVGIIPIIGWIAYFYFKFQIGKAVAKSYGQPESWAWGYTFVEPIFYCITGFGQYSYYGPMGIGDTRTGEAREAKTVDFDVTKDAPAEPVVTAAPEVKVEPAEPEAPVIDVTPTVEPSVNTEPESVDFEFTPSDDASE